MQEYPRSLAEFETWFSSEQACRDYLYRLRWPNGFTCPRCSSLKAWPITTTLCECSGCHYIRMKQNEQAKLPSEFPTKDIYIASVIKQSGIPILRVENHSGRGIFVFQASEKIQSLIKKGLTLSWLTPWFSGAGGRNRTDTGWKPRGILSQYPTNRRFPIIFEYL